MRKREIGATETNLTLSRLTSLARSTSSHNHDTLVSLQPADNLLEIFRISLQP